MIFVDTNYWIRYLSGEASKQGQIVRQLFLEAARGECQLCSNSLVFFEIYWVMLRVYEKSGADLQNLLRELIKIDCVNWDQKVILSDAVELMSELNYDLEDAFHLVWAKENDVEDIASFDQKLRKKWQSLS